MDAWAWTGIDHIPPVIYTSPLARAFETATIIAKRLNLPSPTPIPALIERHHGAGEGLTVERRTALWGSNDTPGRETDVEIRNRLHDFLTTCTEDALLVTHAGVIYALTGHKVGHLETVTL